MDIYNISFIFSAEIHKLEFIFENNNYDGSIPIVNYILMHRAMSSKSIASLKFLINKNLYVERKFFDNIILDFLNTSSFEMFKTIFDEYIRLFEISNINLISTSNDGSFFNRIQLGEQQTILHEVARRICEESNNNIEILQTDAFKIFHYLILLGANSFAQNSDGQTPRDIMVSIANNSELISIYDNLLRKPFL